MADYQFNQDDLTHMFSSGQKVGNGQTNLGLVDGSVGQSGGQTQSQGLGADDLFHLFSTKGGTTQPSTPTPGQSTGFAPNQWGTAVDPSQDLPINGPVTQGFGATDYSAANPQIYHGSGHNGVDIGVPNGTQIPDPAGGTVVQVGDMGKSAYGKYVVVKGTDGVTRLYGHLSQQDVKPGQVINPGTVLGLSGSTGDATGPHLHYSEFKSTN